MKKKLNYKPRKVETIFLGAGCFWGAEKFFAQMPGVLETKVGFIDVTKQDARFLEDQIFYIDDELEFEPLNYLDVKNSSDPYPFVETVFVKFDPDWISAKTLINRYFEIIDPFIEARQGHDEGFQYSTIIGYTTKNQKELIEQKISEIEAQDQYQDQQKVLTIQQTQPYFLLTNEEHQDYLDKNPQGYCHLSPQTLNQKFPLIDSEVYTNFSEDSKKNLSDISYRVTQESDTEEPETGEYEKNFEKGIYVDIVSGEPLFFSSEKFESGCGWPSFSQPISNLSIQELTDHSIPDRVRTEVKSQSAKSHLGHVFTDGPKNDGSKDLDISADPATKHEVPSDAIKPKTPTGLRYCINSASLKFIPLSEMEKSGYGFLIEYI